MTFGLVSVYLIMNNIISTQTSNFESIKTIKNDSEFWSARELMKVLGYVEWRKFESNIDKAEMACKQSGYSISDHFVGADKEINTGKTAKLKIKDYLLSRYACYLIAQNGDSRKPQIALAQTYFAVQTRRQELTDQLNTDNKRLFILSEVAVQNKKLFSTATKSGVKKFGLFNDAGYRGLYNHTLSEIEHKKGI